MKKILLLSANTGQGHNVCARALKEYLEELGMTCEIVDALTFISRPFARFMEKGHSMIYCHFPFLLRTGYQSVKDSSSSFQPGSLPWRWFTSGHERLHHFLTEGAYDTVLCTHVYAAMMLSRVQEERALPLTTAFLATDYSCTPGLASTCLSHYFLSDVSLFPLYEKAGIPREKLTLSGIPTHTQFHMPLSGTDARKKLGIPANACHLLIMGGSMGCGNIPDITRKLLALADLHLPELSITIICGKNKTLQKKLKRIYQNKKINILGYTDQVSLYMAASDLFLTKPGGLCVTEAASIKLPMVLMDLVGANEKDNLLHFTRMDSAVAAASPDEAARTCIRLLNRKKELAKMASSYPDMPDAREIIIQTLLKQKG